MTDTTPTGEMPEAPFTPGPEDLATGDDGILSAGEPIPATVDDDQGDAEETAAILADPDAMAAIAEGEAELAGDDD